MSTATEPTGTAPFTPAKVYIVIGEAGWYEDRHQWVAGIYLDRAEALAVAWEKSRPYREYEASFQAWKEQGSYGNPPPITKEPQYTVVEAPIGQWGKWESIEP